MTKKAKIGDIVEIPTGRGYAYAQFSHYHEEPPRFGALLRVLPGFFQDRPGQFASLVGQKESFSTFFPLQAALNRQIFQVVAHEPVPSHAQKFPLFRAGNADPATGRVNQWWLWDGAKSWKIEKLCDEHLDLPIKAVWNDTFLIERIEEGWTPRQAEHFAALARAKKAERI